MNEQSMREALSAIHDEAMKLLELDLSPDADEIIERIIAIARYEQDIRTAFEVNRDDQEVEMTEEDRRWQEMLESDDPNIWTQLT